MPGEIAYCKFRDKQKMKKPKVLILRTAGTNCDNETAFAFQLAGGVSEFVHINELITGRKKMAGYQIFAIPGGFTYGDDIASGKILANELKFKLGADVEKFIKDGKLIIGICNGFQVLAKAGLLPGIGRFWEIESSLTLNDSARFEDRWVYLSPQAGNQRPPVKCIWTKDLPTMIYLPVAHGEGKFIPKGEGIRKKLWERGQVVLQYVDGDDNLAGYPFNPNGSVDNIAGICDTTGRIFGLMPHPERHIFRQQHPRRTDNGAGAGKAEGDGMQIFRNAVEYAKANL